MILINTDFFLVLWQKCVKYKLRQPTTRFKWLFFCMPWNLNFIPKQCQCLEGHLKQAAVSHDEH